MFVLWYYTHIHIITSRRVFYEVIKGNKHEALGFKAKIWGLGAKSPAASEGNKGS